MCAYRLDICSVTLRAEGLVQGMAVTFYRVFRLRLSVGYSILFTCQVFFRMRFFVGERLFGSVHIVVEYVLNLARPAIVCATGRAGAGKGIPRRVARRRNPRLSAAAPGGRSSGRAGRQGPRARRKAAARCARRVMPGRRRAAPGRFATRRGNHPARRRG